MSGSFWVWGGLALGTCWVVGLYNRLTRIQVRGMAALRSVEKHVRRCMKLIDEQMKPIADTDPQSGAWSQAQCKKLQEIQMDLQQLDHIMKATKGASLSDQSISQMGQLFKSVQENWQQWHGECSDVSAPDAVRVAWENAALRGQLACVGLNQILTKYNEAINQFPARVLARWMGFRAAELM